jgi:hypothetical protein
MGAAAAVSSMLGRTMRAQAKLATAGTMMDHLLLGAADLDRGIEWVETLTGVRAAIGGSHPGRGTRNALLSLGRRQYLEIIAPDPAQPPESLSMNVRGLAEPRLIGWAAGTADIDDLAREIRGKGLTIIGPRDGSRARPDGRVLEWRTLGVSATLGGGDVDPIPFFIQWTPGSVHPSQDSPKGCDLSAFEFGHADPDALLKALRQLGIEATVTQSTAARLTAILKTPKGRVVIT